MKYRILSFKKIYEIWTSVVNTFSNESNYDYMPIFTHGIADYGPDEPIFRIDAHIVSSYPDLTDRPIHFSFQIDQSYPYNVDCNYYRFTQNEEEFLNFLRDTLNDELQMFINDQEELDNICND